LTVERVNKHRVFIAGLLTNGKSADAIADTTWRGKIAGGCTGQIERSCRQRNGTSIGDDDPAPVNPRVTRLRITVRHARQYVTLHERPT